MKDLKNTRLLKLSLIASCCVTLLSGCFDGVSQDRKPYHAVSSKAFPNVFLDPATNEITIIIDDDTYLLKGAEIIHLESGSYVNRSLQRLNQYRQETNIKPRDPATKISFQRLNQFQPETNIKSLDPAEPIDTTIQDIGRSNDLSSLIAQEIKNNRSSSEALPVRAPLLDKELALKEPQNESPSADGHEKNKNLTIDLSKIKETSSHIYYGDAKIQKIGFHENGGVMTPEDQIKQVQGMYKSIEDKADSWSIAYKAKDEKTSIVVFSDPTCGFCRMLHKDIPKLNDAGVSVYILYYPRSLMAGNESAAASTINQMRATWCDKNPSEALDKLYKGVPIDLNNECTAPSEQNRANFPMNEHYLLGRIFNLEATPLIISKEGKKIYGYSKLNKLLAHIMPEDTRQQ